MRKKIGIFTLGCLVIALACLPLSGTVNTVDFLTRITNLEKSVFGGPNPASNATPVLVKSTIDQVASGDGAITPLAGGVLITKGSAAALTIAAPTATVDDGKTLRIVSTTAFAHVITSGTVGFNGKGSSGTATFAAAKGATVILWAYQGNWYVIDNIGVTIA